MIEQVLDLLRCPRCTSGFALDPTLRSVRCVRGHAYDLAKQGYLNLTGSAPPAHADTASMISARAYLLGSGRYAAVSDGLVSAVAELVETQVAAGSGTTVLDVGTGTGHYVAQVLEARPDARGLGLDISVAACRRAARAHPRLGVITADAWTDLPIGTETVDLVLSVFSPRNAGEFARVLRTDGRVVTVTPTGDHLIELRESLELLRVEPGKEERLAASFGAAGMIMERRWSVRSRDPWSAADAVASIAMGPNAFHSDTDEIGGRATRLDWPRPVTISCDITAWRAVAAAPGPASRS